MAAENSRVGRAKVALALLLCASSPTYAQRREPEPPAPSVTQPATEIFPLELWLHAQYGFQNDARPAPGIRVEIGIRDVKVAAGPESQPLELERAVLATATSDAQGELHALVDAPYDWRRRPSFLWVRVETPEHLPTRDPLAGLDVDRRHFPRGLEADREIGGRRDRAGGRHRRQDDAARDRRRRRRRDREP